MLKDRSQKQAQAQAQAQVEVEVEVRLPDGSTTIVSSDDLSVPPPAWTLFPLVAHDYQRAYEGAPLLAMAAVNPATGHRLWLGSDATGQDVLGRMVFGARVSMTIGVLATFVSMTIGIIIGAISGYLGGWVDLLLQRIVEVLMMFPSFILILIIVASLGKDIFLIVLVSALFGWAGTARD